MKLFSLWKIAYLVGTDIAVGLLPTRLVIGPLTQRWVIGLLSLSPCALVLHLGIIPNALPTHALVDVWSLLNNLLLTSLVDNAFVVGTLNFFDSQSAIDSLGVLYVRPLVCLHLILLGRPLVGPLLAIVLERNRYVLSGRGYHLMGACLDLDLVLSRLSLVRQDGLGGHRLKLVQIEAGREVVVEVVVV